MSGDSMTFQPGQVIDGKYRLVQVIGEGGMGIVFEAENVRIKRRVALKLLKTEVAQNGDNVTRFEREAQAAARIGSRHIVEVLDLGDLPDGSRYIVMEYLDGESLGARLGRGGSLAPLRAVQIVIQMLEGLKRAHDAGIIHRDLKPENVFLARAADGEVVKLLDFGISKFSDVTGLSMTRTGAMLGTPAYMSPEQVRGFVEEVDHRVDVYAAGVILFEAIAGQLPYLAESLHDLLFRIGTENARSLRSVIATIDPELDAIVARALVREPAARFARAHDFQAALAGWVSANVPHEAVAPTLRGPALRGTVRLMEGARTPVPTPSPPSSSHPHRTTLPYTAPPDSHRAPAPPTPAAWGAGPTSQVFVNLPSAATESLPAQPPVTQPAAPTNASRKTAWLAIASLGALVVVGGGITLGLTRTRGPTNEDARSSIGGEASPVQTTGAEPTPTAPVTSASSAASSPPPETTVAAPSSASSSSPQPPPAASTVVPVDPRRRETLNGRRVRTTL